MLFFAAAASTCGFEFAERAVGDEHRALVGLEVGQRGLDRREKAGDGDVEYAADVRQACGDQVAALPPP